VLATEAGAAFFVTCTGFNEGGATKDDVQSIEGCYGGVQMGRGRRKVTVKAKVSDGMRTFLKLVCASSERVRRDVRLFSSPRGKVRVIRPLALRPSVSIFRVTWITSSALVQNCLPK